MLRGDLSRDRCEGPPADEGQSLGDRLHLCALIGVRWATASEVVSRSLRFN